MPCSPPSYLIFYSAVIVIDFAFFLQQDLKIAAGYQNYGNCYQTEFATAMVDGSEAQSIIESCKN
ncbi:MAG TPA: hypothetical protein PLM07_17220 [Candidatus Rifleibacterium sp.]|nr:hypothetical protein [Candidatus Rifleibacterium sp.]HPT47622.1 hypothetical protein [Candidatus Rifleibacterium sp.]